MCFPDSGYDDGDDGTSEVLTRSGACEGEDIEFDGKEALSSGRTNGSVGVGPSFRCATSFFFYVSNFLIEFVLLAVEPLSSRITARGLR